MLSKYIKIRSQTVGFFIGILFVITFICLLTDEKHGLTEKEISYLKEEGCVPSLVIRNFPEPHKSKFKRRVAGPNFIYTCKDRQIALARPYLEANVVEFLRKAECKPKGVKEEQDLFSLFSSEKIFILECRDGQIEILRTDL